MPEWKIEKGCGEQEVMIEKGPRIPVRRVPKGSLAKRDSDHKRELMGSLWEAGSMVTLLMLAQVMFTGFICVVANLQYKWDIALTWLPGAVLMFAICYRYAARENLKKIDAGFARKYAPDLDMDGAGTQRELGFRQLKVVLVEEEDPE